MVLSLNDVARRARAFGGALFLLGLAIGGCATHEYFSELPWMPNGVTPPKVAVVSAVFIVVGAAIFAASWSVQSLQWMARSFSRAFTIRMMAKDYRLIEMKATDLPNMYPVYRTVFGAEVIPQGTVAAWMAKKPRIAWTVMRAVKKRGSVRQELIGFFELLPLTKAGEAKLRREFPDTGSLTKDDIHSATRWSSARAYYVASVGVINPERIRKARRRLTERAKSEGMVTKMLFQTILRLGARGRIEICPSSHERWLTSRA